MNELNAYLLTIGYYPVGYCAACKRRPFRWKHSDGHEVKLYKDGQWLLIDTTTKRYGTIETAINEIKDYYLNRMAEATH